MSLVEWTGSIEQECLKMLIDLGGSIERDGVPSVGDQHSLKIRSRLMFCASQFGALI